MRKELFNNNWYIEGTGQEVSLPYIMNGWEAAFVKHYTPDRSLAGGAVYMEIGGAYRNSRVYVNGALAGNRPSGHGVYYVPLHKYLNFGEDNEIRISVYGDPRAGGEEAGTLGIYEDVYLLSGGNIHMVPEGARIDTVKVEKDDKGNPMSAYIRVRSDIEMEDEAGDIYESLEGLWSDEYVRMAEGNENDEGSARLGSRALRFHITVRDMGNREVVDYISDEEISEVRIETPEVWSPDNPALYTYYIEVIKGDYIEDICEGTFAVRDDGSALTEKVKSFVKKVENQSENEGDCENIIKFLPRWEIRLWSRSGAVEYVKELKKSGVQILWQIGAPLSMELVRACDEVGMLVVDEAFDVWTQSRRYFDYGVFFTEWWREDIAALCLRDYNHPSVLAYSMGSDIPERESSYGAELYGEMIEEVALYDKTRGVI